MKKYTKYVLLFTFAYFTSYLTRINFGAIVSEMSKSGGFSKALLSLSLTGSFITYGVGQIISGICGDKISPKKLVSLGFIVTILMNLLIPICPDPYWMLGVWCINGFAQSFMWPPMVKLMTAIFTDDEYKSGCQKISWGSAMGTMVIYLVSPLLISISGWKTVFFFSAICGAIMLIIWHKSCEDIKPIALNNASVNGQPSIQKGGTAMLFSPLMLCIMLAIVLQGMLRDGITTWMPSYISETYKLSNIIGILTGVILPIFSILSFNASSILHRKKFTNPLTCATVIFSMGTVSSVLLVLVTGKSAALSVVASALITGCMHGVNLMLIGMIPSYFKKYGNVSTASGVINSCTYIGSAISTYGIAVFSTNYGWNFTLKLWVIIAFFGTALCFVSIKPWKKKFM